MAEKKTLREICEDHARAGNPHFAIAAALFDLSESQEATASAIQRLGNGNASTHFGAIEGLSMQVSSLAERLGQALDGAAQQISAAISQED